MWQMNSSKIRISVIHSASIFQIETETGLKNRITWFQTHTEIEVL